MDENHNEVTGRRMEKTLLLIKAHQFKQALEVAEQEIYLKAYDSTGKNESATARLLGVSRTTLRSKLREWGIKN
jgi:DNA-binding NtrC family response regulator